jgi:hypothetical protein
MAGKTITTEKKKETDGISRRQAEVISKLLEQVEKNLGTGLKASLGDYIRLVQLQKELEEDEVREIKVTWVEPEGPTEETAPEIKTPVKEPKGSTKEGSGK